MGLCWEKLLVRRRGTLLPFQFQFSLGISLTDGERKKDDDYIRVVDGLARFFNSQITSHGGYLLTMVVIALALSNLVLNLNVQISHALGLPEYVGAIIIIFLTSFGLYLAMEWGVARLQYYIALSEVALDHLPYTASGPASGPAGFMELYYNVLKARALESTPSCVNSLGVRSAISRLFEARLYVSCQNEKNKTRAYELSEQEQKIFHLSEYYSHWGLGQCYAKDSVLRIWRQTNLLLIAYRRTLGSYKKSDPGENREVWNLFKEFVDC